MKINLPPNCTIQLVELDNFLRQRGYYAARCTDFETIEVLPVPVLKNQHIDPVLNLDYSVVKS
jgi:hypothetical protein